MYARHDHTRPCAAPASHPRLLAAGGGVLALHAARIAGYAILNLDGAAPAAHAAAAPFHEAAGFRRQRQTRYEHPSGLLLDCVHMIRP